MSGPFIVLSRSRIQPGKAVGYAEWCADMFSDVEEQEPRLLAFNQWETEDDTSVVLIQVHPDAESFEYHLKLFGERVQQTRDYIDLDVVELYGPPNPFVGQFVDHGIGGVKVITYPRYSAGFTRLRRT